MANEVTCDGGNHGRCKEIPYGYQVYCKDCYDALLDKISDMEDEMKEYENTIDNNNERIEELESIIEELEDAKKEI